MCFNTFAYHMYFVVPLIWYWSIVLLKVVSTYTRHAYTFVCEQFMFRFEATHKLIIFLRVFVLKTALPQPVQHWDGETVFMRNVWNAPQTLIQREYLFVFEFKEPSRLSIFSISWACHEQYETSVSILNEKCACVRVGVCLNICWPIGMTLNLLIDFYQQYAKVSCIRTQDTDNYGMEYADHCSSLAKSISVSMNH